VIETKGRIVASYTIRLTLTSLISPSESARCEKIEDPTNPTTKSAHGVKHYILFSQSCLDAKCLDFCYDARSTSGKLKCESTIKGAKYHNIG
jgi:hypothetical protein